MEKHPIGDLMDTTMSKIRDMVDVNTVVGAPITTVDGITLIPVSRVSFGFAAGGSEFQTRNGKEGQSNPFGGGSGAGVKIESVSFLVIQNGSVKLISANAAPQSPVEKLIDQAPAILDKVKEYLPNRKDPDLQS